MIDYQKYPKDPDYNYYRERIEQNAKLAFEYGADSEAIQAILDGFEEEMKKTIEAVKAVPISADLAEKEPDDLERIKALRPEGKRKIWSEFNSDEYFERLTGAFIGRMAGCTLGAPVEFWTSEGMKSFAEEIGDSFPPVNYWSKTKFPYDYRYKYSRFPDYTADGLDGVPCDDDTTYTMLGLLLLEDFGPDFTVDDVGEGWKKYLPFACTAEDIALKNLNKGVDAMSAGESDNPFVQWIGADIRSDPWGYAAPGYPEMAAEYAYRDAYISHRRNGIYGEMYFSAVISAAFAVDDPIEALRIGLQEIPAECLLAADVKWALEKGPSIKSYIDAIEAVKAKFGKMSGVHTNINACLTIFGLFIGGRDFTKVISEVVAMGYDNDCTAATAGSIVGAVIGIKNIPEYWYKNFNNKVITYINDNFEFKIDDSIKRFAKLAKELYNR